MTRLEENGSEWEQLGIPCIRAATAGETPPPGDPPALYGKPGLSPVGFMYDTHNTVRAYSWHSCTPELRNDSTVIFSAQGTRKQWCQHTFHLPLAPSLLPSILTRNCWFPPGILVHSIHKHPLNKNSALAINIWQHFTQPAMGLSSKQSSGSTRNPLKWLHGN